MGFKEAAIALKSHATFIPHMNIYDGFQAKCVNENGSNECHNLCTNGGRYCAIDPDRDLDTGISGADVVTESLRSICIWELYSKEDGVGTLWWDYNKVFIEKCDNEEKFMNEDCVQDVMNQVGIDKGLVDECMESSGGLEGGSTNMILDQELRDMVTHGVVSIPMVHVNGMPIHGTTDLTVIFKAICDGYWSSTSPAICDECAKCDDVHDCVINGQCFTEGKNYTASIQKNNITEVDCAVLEECIKGYCSKSNTTAVKEEITTQMPVVQEEQAETQTTVNSIGLDSTQGDKSARRSTGHYILLFFVSFLLITIGAFIGVVAGRKYKLNGGYHKTEV